MLCPFCRKANKDKKYVRHWNTKIKEHLIVTLSNADEKGKVQFHVHGSTGNKKLMEIFLNVIAQQSGILITTEIKEEPKNEAKAETG